MKLRPLLVSLLSVLSSIASAQVSMLTHHNDNARTGANLSESILNTTNVNVNQFGKLFSLPVDASVYVQPLYVPNVTIPGKGTHNVLYVATMNDTVYAFDADSNTGANASPLWQVSFVNAAAGITPIPSTDVQPLSPNIEGNIGVTGTPAIDASTKTMYLVARTKENGSYFQRLHALDITTGAEKFSGPVTITGSYKGTNFDPKWHNQRPSLALANGNVYLSWASHNDYGTYHGWVMAYSASTLQQVGIWHPTPTGNGGGIWMSAEAPVVDASGNLYYAIGNGTWDGTNNFGTSVVKLSPTLTVLDWFTPDNYQLVNQTDLDFGSSGLMKIPGTNIMVVGSKLGILYLMDGTKLGGIAAGNPQITQAFLAANGNIHGTPAYYNSPTKGPLLYVWGEWDYLKAFKWTGSGLNTTPDSQSYFTAPDGMPGGFITVTANGSTNGTGIVWVHLPYQGDGVEKVVPGVLRAFDANDVSKELWSSERNPGRDRSGNFGKFTPPTVVNGKAYLATFSNQVVVYGLLPQVNDFTLSSAPTTQAVAPGNSVYYGVSVADVPGSAFNGTVNFSVSGLPTGATASFSPSSVTGDGGSTLTVTTSSSTPVGNYTLTVNGTAGSSSHSLALTLSVSSQAAGVGAGVNTDIGAPTVAGSSSYNAGTYSVTGAGRDIWTTSDQFQFTYWQMAGDGQLVARMTSPAGPSQYAKSGVMIRDNLYPNSPYAFVEGSPTLGAFQWRNAVDAFSTGTPYFTPSYPMWIKVVRQNNNFTGFRSSDGQTWTQVGPATTINMHPSVFAGLAVTSNNVNQSATATFDNVSFTPITSNSPDFNVTATPLLQDVVAGNSASYSINTLALKGFSGTVNLTVSGLPTGATASFAPASVTGTANSTLQINTSASTPANNYTITVTATSGSMSRVFNFILSVVNYTMGAAPSSQTVAAGSSTTFTISDTAQNSFNGIIDLSITGLPAGVTAVFDPTSVDRLVTSTLTLFTSGSTPAGTYPLTVQGTSGGQTRTTSISLTVTGSPSYALSATPSSATVLAGGSASYSATVTASGGFNGAVALSASGLPSGATASFSPTSVTGSGTSSLTVATTSATPAGTFPITISGVNGSTTKTATVSLVVTKNADFTIAASPSSASVVSGGTATYTATIAPVNGFGAAVALSVTGVPSGATASFSPTSVTGSGTSSLTVSSGTAASGSYTLTLTGTSGSLTHSATVTLVIGANVFGSGAGSDSDIGSPAQAGSGAFANGTYTVKGSGADIWNSSDQFNFNYWPMSGDGTFTARLVSLTNTNTYAKAGIMVRSSLDANAPFAFAVGLPALTGFHVRTAAGAAAYGGPYYSPTYPMWLRLVRSNGNFFAYYSLDGTNWRQMASSISVNMPASVYVGLAVTSHDNTKLNTAVFDNLSYTPAGAATADFTVSATPALRSIAAGSNATFAVTTTVSNGFNSAVNLSVTGLPSGATANFSPATVTGAGASTLTVTTSGNTPAGTYYLNVVGTSGSLVRTFPLTLAVTTAPDFTVSGSPNSQTVAAGSNTSYTVTTAALNGFSGSVGFSVTGLPTGATATFTPPAVTGSGSSALAVSTSSSTPAGTYALQVQGTSGSLTRTANLALVVTSSGGGTGFGNGNGTDADIASPTPSGSATVSNGTYTVKGAGIDVWYGSDQFNYNYWPLNGDGTFTARLTSLTGGGDYAKAGIMIRSSLDPAASNAFIAVSPAMYNFNFRTANGNYVSQGAYLPGTAPRWVRLTRQSGNFTAYVSVDGTNWTQVNQTVSISMPAAVQVGLAVTSQNPGQLTTAVFDSLSFTPVAAAASDFTVNPTGNTVVTQQPGNYVDYPLSTTAVGSFSGAISLSASGLPAGVTATFSPATVTGTAAASLRLQTSLTTPAGWYSIIISATGGSPAVVRTTAVTLLVNNLATGSGTNADIGSPALAGSASVANGVFTVKGAGTDIWNTSDQFNYTYWPIGGDFSITARVVSLTNTSMYAKAGVMIRGTLSAAAPFALADASPNLFNYHYRTAAGVAAATGPYYTPTFPMWVRLVRVGSTITAFSSTNGTTWTQLNSPVQIPMGQDVYAGLAVTSQNASQLTTAVFDNVVISQP